MLYYSYFSLSKTKKDEKVLRKSSTYSLSDWIDYYSNITQPSNEYETFFSYLTLDSRNKTLQLTTDNSYVYNCYFHDMSVGTSVYGAAILFSKTGSNLLIEKCSFFYCTAAEHTGAIRVNGGNVILAFVCGVRCKANRDDSFFCSNVDTTIEINSVFDSSVSYCEAKSWYTMVHRYGIFNMKTVNLSYNTAYEFSISALYPNKANDEGYCSFINYCSFSNNTATTNYGIYLNKGSGTSFKHEIKNSNIIGNQGPNTIYSIGETNIYHCTFFNNENPYFTAANSESRIILMSCYSDSSDTEI